MSKKQDFISEVNGMINALGYTWQSENAKAYWEAFISVKEEDKPEFTDNGKLILKYMQDNCGTTENFKAKDIGEGLFVSSRTVSGAIRKLVTDGYVEKIGQDPVIYTLTEKGKNKEIV
jgi:DNA-binding MarR family transcriptional regulator